MKIRVYIQGQYIPHEYECHSWATPEGILYIFDKDEPSKCIAEYNSCDWNIVKVIDD